MHVATWELPGRFPEILEDPEVGPQARDLLRDAHAFLDRMSRERALSPRAVVGLFPACAVGDDVELYTDANRAEVAGVIRCLRQQFAKSGRESLCLSDFVAPRESHVRDWAGAFVATTGSEIEAWVSDFEARQDDYGAILAKTLADRLAEALAEHTHQRVRKELWGYATREALTNEDLIAERYQGIRPAPGYPACPDHSEKRTLFRLLDAASAVGATLTETCAMDPPATVSGWYFAHPAAHYFGVGRIGRDQVEDYARRKGMSPDEAEAWLAPNLAYDPGAER